VFGFGWLLGLGWWKKINIGWKKVIFANDWKKINNDRKKSDFC
jgi:hypothetical protein